jgi:HAD superfamily hydrolase (TIGR01509 family)
MAAVEGVLLDIDGTLVDSNDAHAAAWTKALAEHGFQVEFEKVRRRIGKGGDKLLPQVCGVRADSDQGKAISKRRGEIFREEFLPSLRPTAGAKKLMLRLKQEGVRLAIASSAKADELEGLMRVCGADEVLASITSSDDVEGSKPDPDVVRAALGRIKLPADRAFLLGDTPYDVEAGKRAGVRVVAVRCGGWTDTELVGAIAVYDNPADLLARFEQSPFAGRTPGHK